MFQTTNKPLHLFLRPPQITTGPRESNASISFSPAVRPKAFGTPSNTDGQFITIHEDTLGAYGKDASRVYHISAKTAWIWREVEGADPTTFSVILTPQNTISLYAKDKRAVYYDAVEVSGADPNTFYVISGAATVDGYDYYAKDRKSVYSFAFPVDNADPLTFEPITFKNAGISTYSLFGKDSDGIFCDYDELWADYATFQVLDYNSAIDATHAFEYCTQRTERFPKTISFDSLVQEKQALGVGIGLKFDPNTQDTSANAVATELTHVLDYMKKGADLFYVQYKTYTGYCDNAAMESGMKTLLKRFEGWIGVRSISCISDAQGFMAAVEVPVAGLFCVDTKGYADVIRDFSLYGHTQSSCPAWQTPQLSSDDEDRLTAINLLSLQKEMYEYYQSHDSYKGACESTTIAARIKEMPAYGTWGVYCYADEDRFLAETRLSDTNFACVDSKGNAHRIHGTSQYENQCDLEGETEFLKRVQAGEIEVCVNGVCVPVQDYEYEGIYNDTWDEI